MAENKTITLGQLKKLASRIKTDSAASIAELAGLVVTSLESVQHTGITVTLPAANWNSGVQTVTNGFFLADSRYWYLVYGNTRIKVDDITNNGQITFRCKTVPADDLTVSILRLEVET